jgi:hypothetical protein
MPKKITLAHIEQARESARSIAAKVRAILATTYYLPAKSFLSQILEDCVDIEGECELASLALRGADAEIKLCKHANMSIAKVAASA